MPTQADKAETFRALHAGGRAPLVLFNVWDAGGAKVVAATGAWAIATGSWSVAAAHGLKDGEHLPLDLVIDNLARIVRATDLPVTIDLESGYGETAGEVARSVCRAIEAGAVGCNLEDSFPANGSMRSADQQAERIARVREAARDAGVDLFINARTDVFFQKPADTHDESIVQDALERGRIYAKAGADGLFVPGVIDEKLIGQIAANSPLPVNIMVQAGTPPNRRLAELGVARISYGPLPYLTLMKQLDEAARAVLPEAERVS